MSLGVGRYYPNDSGDTLLHDPISLHLTLHRLLGIQSGTRPRDTSGLSLPPWTPPIALSGKNLHQDLYTEPYLGRTGEDWGRSSQSRLNPCGRRVHSYSVSQSGLIEFPFRE